MKKLKMPGVLQLYLGALTGQRNHPVNAHHPAAPGSQPARAGGGGSPQGWVSRPAWPCTGPWSSTLPFPRLEDVSSTCLCPRLRRCRQEHRHSHCSGGTLAPLED